MNRSAVSGIVFGIFVVLLGMLALLKGVFGFTIIHLTVASFWALVIVAAAITSIVHRGFHFWNVVFLLIGAEVIVGDLGYFGRHTFLALVALLLVALGVYIIVRAVWRPNYSGNVGGTSYTNSDNSDYVKYNSSFSEINASNVSKNFKGGRLSSTFGTIRLDLSQIEIQEKAVLDVSATFGTIEIRFPRNIPYKTDVSPAFGSFVNDVPNVFPVEGMPFIEIKGSAAFGTVRLI